MDSAEYESKECQTSPLKTLKYLHRKALSSPLTSAQQDWVVRAMEVIEQALKHKETITVLGSLGQS